MIPLSVFIGYDTRQPIAGSVLAHSISARSTGPVAITRLQLSKLPLTRRGLTEFTYSRFLVPHLCEYQGISIFFDSDMLCLGDITELLVYPLAYPTVPVFVSKNVRRFEWPSMMVFNNAHCQTLTPEFVQDARHPLFDLTWASEVGEFPGEWNHLVGYDPPNPTAKGIHFTQGIPCWPETKDCEFSAEWHRELKAANSTVSFNVLMGPSVHAQHVQARLAAKAALAPA